MKIILASASPRRRELLEQIGVSFDVRVSQKEERYTSTKPQEIVQELALMKAQNVLEELELKPDLESEQDTDGIVVIGADTIVVSGGKILGKPRDEQDAFDMLTALQGRSHEVYTGVALLLYEAGERKITVHSERTEVHVTAMSEEEIRGYISTGDCMDKAGSYGIQGPFAAYIAGICGDYYNVVGLPVSYVYHALKEAQTD